MIDAKELAKSGCKYLGTPYSKMDCQKFWEKILSDCGLNMDLGGSNSWYRYIMKHGWCGTPEECKKQFGCVPQGATLFIREEVSDSTPEQFKHDGIGDITHMGDYTAMTGDEMCQIAYEAGVDKPEKYNYGNGAIHSSSSRGCVATSKFAGKTIQNGGWNRVGLFTEKINYSGINPEPDPPEPEPPEPVEETAVVVADHGNTVKMRAKPSTKCNLYLDVPVGSVVTVKEHKDDWCKIVYDKITGYMMTQFLDFNPSPSPSTTLYTVHIPYLTKEQAQALLKQYPGSWMTEETQSVG